MPKLPHLTIIAILLAVVSCCPPAQAATAPSVDFASPHVTYPAAVSPGTVAAGHIVSASSVPDIAIGDQNGSSSTVTVLLNSGTGTFTAQPTLALPGSPYSIAIADLGNGTGDIVVACSLGLTGKVCVFIGNGDGTFKTRVDYPIADSPFAMRVTDVTGDGHPDVLLGCSGSIQFLKGNWDANGTLTTAVAVSTGSAECSSLAVGYLDNDTKADIAAMLNGRPFTLTGNGDGTFQSPVACSMTAVGGLSIGIGDFRGHGQKDIAITDTGTSTIHIFLNQGNGVFGPYTDYPVGHYPKSLNPVDLNGDGNLDLVFVNYYDGTIGYLQGNGDGTFQPMIAYTTGGGPYIDAAGDFNGDTKLDLVTSNAAGTVTVLLQGSGTAPAAVANLASSGTTGTTVSLTWTTPLVETRGPASGYQLRYSTAPITSGNFGAATLVTPAPALAIAGSTATFVVPGLTPSTTYYFALESSDAFSRTSLISNVINTATIVDTMPPAMVADLAASGVVRGVQLTWTAPGNDGALGTATSYQIRYSTSAIVDAGTFAAATLVAGVPAPQTAGSAESFTVGGLIPGATYWFALEAADGSGNVSAMSNVVSAVVLDDALAPLAVANLVATAYGERTVQLAWTAPADGAPSGTVTAYQLRMSSAPITVLNFSAATALALPAPGASGASETAAVGGLAAGTTYYFALTSSDGAALTSEMSNVASATTASSDTIPPATVADLVATAAVDGVTLTWTAPGDDGVYGTAASFQVRYSTSAITGAGSFASATAVAGVPAPQAAGTAMGMTVGGLAPGVTYWFALETVDAAANSSALSNVVSAVPTAPAGSGGGDGSGGSSSHSCGLGGGTAALALVGLMASLRLRRRLRQG
jgi:hypothetical protein